MDPIGTVLVFTTLVLVVFGLEVWQVWRLHR
jgi:cytochrome oxidase assembly protein ShyY1